MTDLQEFINQTTRLPTPPAIALKILEAVRSDEINFEELADIVMADPVLTAQVLKIANSSLYSLPKQVTSLSQATGLLGTQTLKNIALSFVIVDSFKDIPQGDLISTFSGKDPFRQRFLQKHWQKNRHCRRRYIHHGSTPGYRYTNLLSGRCTRLHRNA